MRLTTFIVLCTFFGGCFTDDSLTPNGYIFTCPRTLITGGNNVVNLRRIGNLDAGDLKVEIFYKEKYDSKNETVLFSQDYKIQNGVQDSEFNFTLKSVDGYTYDKRIQINGTFGKEKIFGSDSVGFSSEKSIILLIQTDKPLYKPGETVKFRVLKVNKDLKLTKKDNVADVFIMDPKNTILHQFKELDLEKGLVQEEFQLSDEPIFGNWRIKVKTNGSEQFSYFDVKEYVLPKFEVNINFPSYVLSNAEFIPVEVCARYTYGQPVVGTLNLNISMQTYYYYGDDKKPKIEEISKLALDGCFHYELNVSRIENDTDYSGRGIEVVAQVIELGTDVERTVTKVLRRTSSPLSLSFTEGSGLFKPGLPYNGKLKVTHPDGTVAAKESVEICVTTDKKRIIAEWWSTKTVRVCKKLESDDEGIIEFSVLPQNVDATSIELSAKALNYPDDPNGGRKGSLNQPDTSKHLRPFYSPSGSFIQLQPIPQPAKCGSKQNLKLLFTSQESEKYVFFYQVMWQSSVALDKSFETSFNVKDSVNSLYEKSPNSINGKVEQTNPVPSPLRNSTVESCPAAKESDYLPPIGEASFEIDLGSSLTSSRVLVYYVKEDGEVVADSMTINVEKCFPNQVDFKFGDETQQPGLDTSVHITSGANSLCGISAVDKSVLLLSEKNDLTIEKIFSKVSNLDINNYRSDSSCYTYSVQPGLENAEVKALQSSSQFDSDSGATDDAFTAFQSFGMIVISNLFVLNRPCRSGRSSNSYGGTPGMIEGPSGKPIRIMPAGPGGPPVGRSPLVSISETRSNFPETWLFELETTDNAGSFSKNVTVPDTITEWIGSAVCISPEYGLGISNTTSITAFQAFFIDYTLPSSVIRGEEFVLVVSIFSYADAALAVTVSLEDSEGFEVINGSINGDICIEPSTSKTLPVTLKATKIGKVEITVRAETSKSDKVCGSSKVSKSYARDAIRRTVEVEPEGFANENVINNLFCPQDDANKIFKTAVSLELPSDIVPDSARAYMDFTGNVMGPALNNLNNLVALPTGCGEQNMVKFVPNYLVLDYLTQAGKLTEEVKRNALHNLRIGYQRELSYRHYDGSFSAFGDTDRDGSMFLTAFVLRSFYEAKRYIYIDDNLLKNMQKWIVKKQATDGCFPNIGRIFDTNIQGGMQNSGSITAYALGSLLISKYDNKTIVDDAFKCLEKFPPTNAYDDVLYAYTYALAGNMKEAKSLLQTAEQKVVKKDGMESFIIVNATKAIDIEADAYAVLTTLAVGGSAADALPFVRYLTANLNPKGGFSSTQDTCVGLDALSKFGVIVYKDPLDLTVATTGGLDGTVKITDENKLVVQRFKVKDVSKSIDINAKGSGCGLSQVSLRYNTLKAPEQKMFSLTVNGDCLDADCSEAKMNVMVSYLPPGQTAGMSIVEVKLITGFVAVKESINKLKSDEDDNILRVDVQDNTIIVYFSEISNEMEKFSFDVIQVVDVKNAQPGTAKVYDYYANEHSSSVSYVIDGNN